MSVSDLIVKLQELEKQGKGDYEVCDYDYEDINIVEDLGEHNGIRLR